MAIPSIVKSLRVLGDANRLRMLLLLSREELSVAELQEILGMGQSTISTHLAQLKHAGMVEDRRAGKNIWYRSKSGEVLSKMLALLQHVRQLEDLIVAALPQRIGSSQTPSAVWGFSTATSATTLFSLELPFFLSATLP